MEIKLISDIYAIASFVLLKFQDEAKNNTNNTRVSLEMDKKDALLIGYAAPALLALSIELGLKNLLWKNRDWFLIQSTSTEKKFKLLAEGSHNLKNLFNALPTDVTDKIKNDTMILMKNQDTGFDQLIEFHQKTFIEWRYLHEGVEKTGRMSADPEFLVNMVKAISKNT